MNSFQVIVFLILMLTLSFQKNIQAQGKGSGHAQAQKGGESPPWAPAHGYKPKTRYVYFKDFGVYYDHHQSVYIALSGGTWTVSTKLPGTLIGVDLKAAIKIDLDFEGDNPQRDYAIHQKKFPKIK